MAMPTLVEIRAWIDSLNEEQLRALSDYALACAKEDVAQAEKAAAPAVFQAANSG